MVDILTGPGRRPFDPAHPTSGIAPARACSRAQSRAPLGADLTLPAMTDRQCAAS